MRSILAMLAVMLGTLAAPTTAAEPLLPALTAISAQACTDLQATDFGTIEDAPTHVTASKLVEVVAGEAGYCQVQGYVTPNVGFELRLPAAGWNGKFTKIGCGGFCGTIFATACSPLLKRGYACISSNMGHTSTGLDAKWAYNNLQAEFDFASRGTHVATLAGKAITAHVYGRAPSRSYFMGCSTGGRQGLMEAQRFPWDYDGIIAGAPPLNETGDGLNLLWNVVSTLGSDGRSVLGIEHLRTLHAAVIKACDLDDGVADGVIGDPRTCRFDARSLLCASGGSGGTCLTAAQAEAVRRIYAGPVNSKGERLYTSRAMPGSELNWINTYVAADGGPSGYNKFIGDMMRYMNFIPDPGPTWNVTDFDWDKDYRRLDMMEALYSASNPDLRRFKAAGGKLIVYQGWADQSVLPENIIDYYETVQRTMGGSAATTDFFRLFMMPGVNHCAGGGGADSVDYLSYLERWVENGVAPDRMIAVHRVPGGPRFQYGMTAPSADQVEFSRPLFPYPSQARYTGRGDPRDQLNYRAR